MSTRVQKGGQKFKPITKQKPRVGETPSRQSSTQPDYNVSAAQASADSVGEANASLRSQSPSFLHTISEEPNSSSTADPSSEESVPTANSAQRQSALTTEPKGDSSIQELERPSLPSTGLVQDAFQDRADLNRMSSSPAVGSSRAIPVIVPSRTSQRSVQGSAMPIILPSRPTTSFTTTSDGGDSLHTPQIGSDHTLVANVPSLNGARGRQKAEISIVPVRTAPNENLRNKRRRISSSNPTAPINSQEQAGSHSPMRKRTSSKRSASAIESPDVFSESEMEEEHDKESGASPARGQRQRSVTSSSRRGRKRRVPSLPPFDPDGDPGEDLDPTVTTMASICDDTGRGRVSSKAAIILRNHATWKVESKAKRARLKALLEAKKYGRKEEGELAEETEAGNDQPPTMNSHDREEVIVEGEGDPDAGANGFDYNQSMATNRFNVQVRIGPNGETIVDEESLFVDRAEGEDIAAEQYTHVEESDQTKFINSASYSRKSRGSRWSAEETELFYDALSQFGENYELISYVLPGRDRKACKNKFKAEDRKNPNRITFCLNNRVPYDMQTLSRLTGKDFSGPTPEIRMPEMPTLAPALEVHEEPSSEGITRNIRKKSRTPAASDGVEILGDVDSYNAGVDD